MRPWIAVPLALAVAAAGCSQAAAPDTAGGELVVDSAQGGDGPAAQPGPTAAFADPRTAKPDATTGVLVATVVDPAIRPIVNATVRLASLNLTGRVDGGGTVAFASLAPGQLLVRAQASGHEAAQAIVEVRAGETARVKFVLHPIPPPKPQVLVQGFKGITALSNPVTYSCSGCTFTLDVHQPGLRAVVADFLADPYAGPGGAGTNAFSYTLKDGGNATLEYRQVPSPGQARWNGTQVLNWTAPLRLQALVKSTPGPELDKKFQVFVSAWVDADPPEEWDFPTDGNPYP